MDSKKIMKQFYCALLCMSFCTSANVKSERLLKAIRDNPNGAIIAAAVVLTGVHYLGSFLFDDKNSSQSKLLAVEPISVSRSNSNDDLDCVTKRSTEAAQQNGMPRIIITSVVNQTPYDLAIIDVVNDWNFAVSSYKYVRLTDAILENYKNIVFSGNLFNCLHDNHAQIEIRKIEASGFISQDSAVLLNMSVMPGGVNDGSIITTGTLGSLVFKFFMAGPNGGAHLSSGRLENSNCKEIEVQLVLSSDRSDVEKGIFKVFGSYEIVEK